MSKFTAALVKQELPSNFCHKCRWWIESLEVVNLFDSVDGIRKPVTVWTCPECRGDAALGTAVVAAPITQADVSRDERLGPYRLVVEETVALNLSGKTARAKLSCGHAACVLPDAARARCRKCRGGVSAGFDNRHED